MKYISEGFNITLLPEAIAQARGGIAVYNGKFQADITRINPNGSGYTYEYAGPQNSDVFTGLFYENFSMFYIKYYI